MHLSFAALRAANLARLPLFKNRQGEIAHSKPDGSDWSPAEWLQAVTGELGELANLLKKVRRGDFDAGTDVTVEVAHELADVATYLDILAFQLGVDLGAAVIEKFNLVSARVGADVWLAGTESLAEATARADTAVIQRDAVKGSLSLAQTLSEQQQTEILALKGLLREAGRQFRFYEQQHLEKGPDGPAKAKVNADFAARIEAQLGQVARTQGDATDATTDAPFSAWGTGDDEPFSPDGAPNVELASTALQVWSLCQQRSRVTLAEAARAFNVSIPMIREAVDGHQWMVVVTEGGEEIFYHEGE